MMKGIDVSTWQGKYIDYEKVRKSGIDFVIIRAGYGKETSQKDDCFELNYKNAKAAGLLVGAYWYSYALSAAEAVTEAETCMKCIKGKKFDLPVFLDMEESSQFGKGQKICNDIVKSFCDTLINGGYKTGLYMSVTSLMTYISESVRNNYTIWVAQYYNKCQYSGKYAIWQHSSTARISGIDGNVDENYLYDMSIISDDILSTDDMIKFLKQAATYLGTNGEFICKTKLKLGSVYDWCAFAVSAIMQDCGFIGKYMKSICGGAGDIPRYSDGKYGTWFKKGTKAPQAGDLFFLRYADYPGKDKYFCDHVGIVESVNGSIITTLEGNVDGYGSNWAATSTFKRKTRYLTDNSVYAFYRPNWQGETTKTANKNTDTDNIDVTYQVHTVGGGWLPNVKNLEDYAGFENHPIDGIYASTSKGHIRYRVKLIGGKNYLPWVIDREDYAGILGKQIDCVQMELIGIDGYTVEYRVSTANSTGYLDWVQGYNNDNEDGYAGLVGVAIDKLMLRIIKG